ncbi:MAG: hypothetical protein JNK10_11845 [Cyclobacteriaceae bacterium]|nr:hypothetical protein [Cyclobacteriaceae bacterium]
MRSLFLALILVGCSSDLTDDPIPIIPFADFVVNLSAPEYQPLVVNGGYKEIGSIGVRGVILYRQDAATYLAFERNCSYHPNDACATVNVHSSNLFMVDPCCNSSFSFTDGSPTGGIAWRPLRRYETSLVGNTLTITSTIVD